MKSPIPGMHRMPAFALLLAVALALPVSAAFAASPGAPLKPPPEFTYDAAGVTHATLRAASTPVDLGGHAYETLVFNGSYDAPLLRTRPGGTIKVTVDNAMAETTNLHFHGMTVTPLDSGDSIFRTINPVEVGDYQFRLPPEHSPGAYWYHSHIRGGSERQVSAGIAGPILVEGMLDPFPELKGITERVMVLRNFQTTMTGKVASEIITSHPSIRTINGQVEPVIEIRPGETQLWHFLNIAANQYFRIRLAGQSFQILSRDGNTVNQQVLTDELLIGPSARFSVLVVGPPAGDIALEMGSGNTGASGDQYSGDHLATLRSAGAPVATRRLTSSYPVLEDYSKQPVAQTRQFAFQDSPDDGAFMINGQRFDARRVNTTVKLGDLEEWRLYNPSQELHQFHIHQTDFQVVAINDKPVAFTGYQDNVYIPTRGSITVRIPFRDEVALGKFVYHCHILEHEDGGMMQVIQVVRPEDYAQAKTLERLGGIYGDNQTCTYLQNTGRELQLPSRIQLNKDVP